MCLHVLFATQTKDFDDWTKNIAAIVVWTNAKRVSD